MPESPQRATYTNLPAGSYQLQIIAGNSDEVWSEPGRSLNITVQPAPWNTWWAYILYTLAVAMLLLVYSRLIESKAGDRTATKTLFGTTSTRENR